MAKRRISSSEKPVRRTVVDVDLSHYSEIAQSLQIGHKIGATATRELNDQIQELIRRAVIQSGSDFKKSFVKSTGDGGILQFKDVRAAEQFAVALHQISHEEHCQAARLDLEWRSFRVGIHTGEVVLPPHEIAGVVVGEATRLQAGALSGQIVIDAASWAQLPGEQQIAYGPEEDLQIKGHDPIFKVRRRSVVEAAPWDRRPGPPDAIKKTIWYLPDRDRNPYFIGRTDEIELIREQLKSGQIVAVTEIPETISFSRRIAALIGLGGIGKTQTAIEYAFRYAHDYDYILFLHADDPGKIRRDYARIAKLLALKAWERGLEGVTQIVLEWMSKNTGWLLIVDNVDRPEQVARYLPKRGKGHILVTSRLRTLDALATTVKPIPIGLFTSEKSRELIILLSGRNTEGNPAEETALQEIVRGMGGLPVALEQAATYIRRLPCTFVDYWQEFNERRTELFANSLARPSEHDGIIISPAGSRGANVGETDETRIADRDQAIATTWDINFRRIELEASRHQGTPQSAAPELLLVSAFLNPDDIPMDLLAAGATELGPKVAAALGKRGKLSVNEALHLVHEFSLIEVKSETRSYSMHRLVQEVVRKWWMTDEQRRIWARRVIEVLRRGTNIFWASEANWPTSLKDQHFANFVATVLMDEWKREDFEFEEAAELLSQTGYLLTKTHHNQDAKRFLEQAIQIREKLLGQDHLDVAQTLSHFANNLAESWGERESLPFYERALRIRLEKQGADHADVAQVHNDFGLAYLYLHRKERLNALYKNAETHFLEALRIWKLGGTPNLIGSAMFNLAMLYQDKGGKESEIEEYFRAAHEKVTIRQMRANACLGYGNFLAHRGRNIEALPLLREAREVAKETFGPESGEIPKYNDSLEGVLRSLGFENEAKETDEESERIRHRLRDYENN